MLYGVTKQPCSILACDFIGTTEMFLGFNDDTGITNIFFDNGSDLSEFLLSHQTMGLNITLSLARLMELVISVSKGPIKRSSSVVVNYLPS